jgi:5'-methylthioadenosine phosphorylase
MRDRHKDKSVAVILGSAFSDSQFLDNLYPVEIATPYGGVTLHQVLGANRSAWVVFRHGLPHTWLPNQIPYRAIIWALHAAHCGALLVTSSVGVLDRRVPLNTLLDISDIIMPENRLPGGENCTMFRDPSSRHAHLVLREGLMSGELRKQIRDLASNGQLGGPVVFAYVGGPRTKTRSENEFWMRAGAQVNSMTVGPEIVLANEMEIPCACVGIGHKYSLSDGSEPESSNRVRDSLVASRKALEKLVYRFLNEATPVQYANILYRFEE